MPKKKKLVISNNSPAQLRDMVDTTIKHNRGLIRLKRIGNLGTVEPETERTLETIQTVPLQKLSME